VFCWYPCHGIPALYASIFRNLERPGSALTTATACPNKISRTNSLLLSHFRLKLPQGGTECRRFAVALPTLFASNLLFLLMFLPFLLVTTKHFA